MPKCTFDCKRNYFTSIGLQVLAFMIFFLKICQTDKQMDESMTEILNTCKAMGVFRFIKTAFLPAKAHDDYTLP